MIEGSILTFRLIFASTTSSSSSKISTSLISCGSVPSTLLPNVSPPCSPSLLPDVPVIPPPSVSKSRPCSNGAETRRGKDGLLAGSSLDRVGVIIGRSIVRTSGLSGVDGSAGACIAGLKGKPRLVLVWIEDDLCSPRGIAECCGDPGAEAVGCCGI
jgi:hypothetical protein